MQVVRGGTVVTEEGVRAADVGVEDGRVVAVEPGLHGETLFDARGLHVFPGFVDPHVHACDEGQSDWEDFGSVTAAALAGGVTTLLDMPLNEPWTTTEAAFRGRMAAVRARARCDVGLWAGAVPGNAGELEGMAAAGAVAVKAFMVDAAGWARCDDDDLLAAMREAARLGLPVGVHAERQEVVAAGEARERARDAATGEARGSADGEARDAATGEARGFADVAAHARAHPESAEEAAIAVAIELAARARCRLHVVHVGAARALPRLRAAGHAHAEATIHPLTLDADDRDRLGPRARLAPPLRDRATVEALWQGIADGTIEWVGSDHSPYPPSLKDRDSIWDVPDGAPGVETCFPLLLSEGVHRRGLALERFAALSSAAAARAYGLHPRKGALVPNASDADLAIVDLHARWTIEARKLHYRHPWSLHDGTAVTGRVVATIHAGRLAYADGDVLAPPGSGGLLRR